MSDSKIPPAPKAPSILSATPMQGQKAADSPVSPLSMLKDLPVRQAPSGLERPQKRERETGHIISYDRKTHEMRMATPRGMVTVKTEQALPPGEDVIVELYVEKGVTLATITLLREEQAAAEELQKIIPPAAPAPPLKAGDAAVAILIAEDTPDTVSTAPKPTLQQAAQVLEQLRLPDIQRLPQPLPLPTTLIMKMATAPDMHEALQSLPPAQQQAVRDYLARPDVITALPPPAARVLLQQTPAVPPTSPGDAAPLEAELILRTSPTPPVRTEATGAPAPAPAAPTPQQALAALKGLLDTQQAAAIPFSGLMRMMVAGAMQTPQSSQASPFAAMMPQNMYHIKIVSIVPPGQPAPTPPAGQPAPLQGEIESLTENGFPVIRAGESRYILKLPTSAEVGSAVLFEAMPLTSQQAMSVMQGTIPAAPAGPGFGGFSWPAMDETLEALPAYSPAGQALRNSLPTATPRMVPTALFFLAALRMGAVESWLGSNLLDTLRQAGKTGLADKLSGDFVKMAAQAKEPVSGEWRMIQMPMLHDEQLSQMQFYLRRQQDESGEEKEQGAKPSTRFVLNLHLSRMGDLQLDGLMRQKRFDLIFRSGEALPLNMRQEMMQGFAKGLDQAGMQGGISFQTRAQNWVTVELPHKGTLA